MTRLSTLIAVLLFTTSAHAQLDKVWQNKDKILKGGKVVKAAVSDVTPEQELEIGKVVAGKVLFNYHLVANDKLQDYVTLIGQTLVPYSERPNDGWHFAVVDTDLVNAFSTPGNFVFITTGALKQMHSEAELATVIGHEIAHVEKKHILNEVKKANVFAAGMELATDGSGGFTEELAKKIGDLAYKKLFETGVGRREETEADQVGVQLAAKAGYKSEAMVTFLTTLDQLFASNNSRVSMLGKTHPSPKDRITSIKTTVTATGATLDDRFKKWTASL